MEGDKPLTRDALVSMQVIDARGRLVGKVKDVVFAIGKMGISLTVENDDGETKTVGWEEVQAAADFIILKPQQYAQNTYQPQPMQQQPVMQQPVQPVQPVMQPVQPQPVHQQPQASQPMCPTCGKPLTWIAQYKRWYCYSDKKYV
jgi:sporulation protein YlmC with PRC-barrel domain